MTIHGVEINDNMDIKDIIILFNTLVVASESIHSELEENFGNYRGISNTSVESLVKYKELLQSITAIQVKTQKAFEQTANMDESLIKKVTYLQDKIQEENKQTYIKIRDALVQVEPFTQNAINKAVKNVFVDTSKIESSIERKLESFDVSDINNTIAFIDERSQALHSINKTFYTNIEHLSRANENLNTHTQALKDTVSSVNDAVKSFKGINKSVSIAMSAALLFVGLVLGFGVATFFKIEAVSGYYFSAYDEKQALMEEDQAILQERVSSMEKLPEFLAKHNIRIDYGIYGNDPKKIPYLLFQKEQTYSEETPYTFERKGEKFIGFR